MLNYTADNADRYFLQQALRLAQRYRGFCAPNPAVGAVVVHNGNIIAEGAHMGAGFPHAEVVALSALIKIPLNTTLYITLEPCCHYGRTPPCTDFIIKKGIKRVVFATYDPNLQVNGQGAQQLLDAGINCTYVNVKKVNQFYASYHYWFTNHTPIFTAKLAMSLDGKYAQSGNERILFTGKKIAKFTHQCRKHNDAILTSAKTILFDNPLFNSRLNNETIAKPIIVLDRQLSLPLTQNIFHHHATVYLFHSFNQPASKIAHYQQAGIHCIAVAETAKGLNLTAVAEELGKLGFHDIWIEAGATVLATFLEENLVQRLYLYIAPKWLGTTTHAVFCDNTLLAKKKMVKWHVFGKDAACEFIF